jgi:hypothetical protein
MAGYFGDNCTPKAMSRRFEAIKSGAKMMVDEFVATGACQFDSSAGTSFDPTHDPSNCTVPTAQIPLSHFSYDRRACKLYEDCTTFAVEHRFGPIKHWTFVM